MIPSTRDPSGNSHDNYYGDPVDYTIETMQAEIDRLNAGVDRVRALRDKLMDAEEAPESSVWVLNQVLAQFGVP